MVTLLQKAEEIRNKRIQDNQNEKDKKLFTILDELPFIKESFLREFAEVIKYLDEAGVTYEVKAAKFPNANSKFYVEFRFGKNMCGMPYQLVHSTPSWKFYSNQEYRQWPMEDFIIFITDQLFIN